MERVLAPLNYAWGVTSHLKSAKDSEAFRDVAGVAGVRGEGAHVPGKKGADIHVCSVWFGFGLLIARR